MEQALGKLVMDVAFRDAFFRDPLAASLAAGIQLTDQECSALERIPPGDYVVFASDDVENGEWQNPDFLRAYERRGTPVRIGDGAQASVNLLASPR